MFLLYVNDIVNASPLLFPILFADDTNVFLQGKDKMIIAETLNKELLKVVEWLHVNKLSLNVNKTHYVLFTLSDRPVTFHYDIKIEGLCIQRVTSKKFLGIIIDQNLKWIDHIRWIQSKIEKGIGMLARARRVLAS